MKPSTDGGSKHGDRMPSSSNKRGGVTFIQNKHVGIGGYNISVISSRVQSTPSIQTPLESLQNVRFATRNMPIENEDIHAHEETHEDNTSPSICSSASSHGIRRNVNRAPIQGSHDKFSKRNTQLHSEVQQSSKKRGRNDDNLNAQGKPMVYLKSFKKSLVNVARATVESRDPLKKVGGCDLGYEYWEVAIHVALLHNEPLPRPYGQFKTIGDAIGATIAWPFTFVTRAEE